jgi:3-hydroxyacyl-[acyl-carrier-protein] dehydratase
MPNMEMMAYVDVRPDAFWVRGHIPGRPLMPGVLMIESSAQMISYFAKKVTQAEGFIGFGGVTDVKFRGQVVPGQKLVLLGKLLEMRARRTIGATQGYIDGTMVYEGTITGMLI